MQPSSQPSIDYYVQSEIRPLDVDDIPFVLHSWVTSYYRSALKYSRNRIDHDAYFNGASGERAVALSCLRNAHCDVVCDPEDKKVIIGYVCYSSELTPLHPEPVVHYIFVKNAMRRHGTGKRLLFHAVTNGATMSRRIVCTHLPRTNSVVPKGIELVYNPYLLRFLDG